MYTRILDAGGRIQRKRISSFDELHEFDVVINCTGLGAKALVKNDMKLKAVRGQVMRAKLPSVFEVIATDENYIIPK